MGVKAPTDRVTTVFVDPGLCVRGRNLEVEEAAGLGDVESLEDLGLTRCGVRALDHAALRTLHGDETHAVELLADVAPGVTGRVLDDPHEQQPQPAELHVAADPVLAVMKDRAQSE